MAASNWKQSKYQKVKEQRRRGMASKSSGMPATATNTSTHIREYAGIKMLGKTRLKQDVRSHLCRSQIVHIYQIQHIFHFNKTYDLTPLRLCLPVCPTNEPTMYIFSIPVFCSVFCVLTPDTLTATMVGTGLLLYLFFKTDMKIEYYFVNLSLRFPFPILLPAYQVRAWDMVQWVRVLGVKQDDLLEFPAPK